MCSSDIIAHLFCICDIFAHLGFFLLQCQKKHWYVAVHNSIDKLSLLYRTVHKKVCKVSEIPATFKLIHTLMSDVWCLASLPQALICAVGVDKEFTRNSLYIARCDLSIEPDFSVVTGLSRGTRSVSDYPNGVQGMLQMKPMILLDPSVAIDSAREKTIFHLRG